MEIHPGEVRLVVKSNLETFEECDNLLIKITEKIDIFLRMSKQIKKLRVIL